MSSSRLSNSHVSVVPERGRPVMITLRLSSASLGTVLPSALRVGLAAATDDANESVVTLPNFLVIGAMKAGTTSMHRYLDAHPDVFMATQKELNFFIEELNWPRGPDWYQEHFAGAGTQIARGEASPGYAGYPYRRGVPGRVAELLPHARLIYLVRHPIERMHSQWVHRTLRGVERRSPADALLNDVRYLSKSEYALQVEQYLEHFPRERLLIVVAEEMRADRAGVMGRVFEFLGVDPGWRGPVLEQEFHQTSEKRRRVPIPAPPERVQRLPGYGIVARHAPLAVKRTYRAAARSLARAPRSTDPRSIIMPEGLRVELEDRLRDDLLRFKRLMPPSFDVWGLL